MKTALRFKLGAATLSVLLMTFTVKGWTQTNAYPYKVAQDRMLWHDNVDKEQQKLVIAGGGKYDGLIRLSKDETVNLQVTDALIRQVDELQQQIEFDSTLNTNNKKKYLRGLEFLLRGFHQAYTAKEIQAAAAPALISAFEKAMEVDRKGESIEPVITDGRYEVGKILVECFLYPSENIGVKPSRLYLTRRYCEMHPGLILSYLQTHQGLPFEDSLIVIAGHHNVRQLYDYAAASGSLGYHIRNSKDTLVHTVAMMANSKSGQLYFPFLDNLVKGKISTEDIDKVKGDELNYYRLLVQTRLPAPWGHPGMTPAQAFNTAVSFTTNTSWQNYAGESTLGHVGLATGLGVQAFASAAVGMCVAVALVRGHRPSPDRQAR